MATVLGACGCCGGGCGPVKENCNVVLRQYLIQDDIQITFTTSDDYLKDCWNNRNSQPCYGVTFGSTAFSACTGEGVMGYSYFGGTNPDGTSWGGGGGELGTFTVSYQDESIDWDNIKELELTELEQAQKLCKFSYKFNFSPTTDAVYYVINIPCNDTYDASKSLDSESKVTFYGRYNEANKTCFIY